MENCEFEFVKNFGFERKIKNKNSNSGKVQINIKRKIMIHQIIRK
jgi:hypothetical protein